MSQVATSPGKDLVLLVADKNIEAVMIGLLGRSAALGIRRVTYDCYVHPRRDPGCLAGASDFLGPLRGFFAHALVLFDHEGSGREGDAPKAVAGRVRDALQDSGWQGRAEVVVLAPELEIWVWTNSPHVPRCLGWAEHEPALREWLAGQGLWRPGDAKPEWPKEALEAALREVRKPRSSAIYGDIARSVSLSGHSEPAFVHLSATLRRWFGAESA